MAVAKDGEGELHREGCRVGESEGLVGTEDARGGKGGAVSHTWKS